MACTETTAIIPIVREMRLGDNTPLSHSNIDNLDIVAHPLKYKVHARATRETMTETEELIDRRLVALWTMEKMKNQTHQINGDAIEELREGMQDFVVERLWLADKIRQIQSDEAYAAEHIEKIQQALFFVYDGCEQPPVPVMMDDAEEDDDDMKEKIKSYQSRAHTMQSLQAIHKQNVLDDIHKTREIRSQKAARKKLIAQRIKELKQL